MKLFDYVFSALLMLGLAIPSQAQSPAGAAVSIPGEFSVSATGAANYTIPIQVPPGVAGMAPKLALVYNSQRGNGMLGVGWGLSGLSAITRCGPTAVQDGYRGGINFNVNDRFCLDGQRLMPFAGSYGAAGSEYRTEIDSFSKIVANGAVGAGPISFTVKTKSGLTLEYGNTTDSRIEAVKGAGIAAFWSVGTVRIWALNKVTDLSGNYMTVSYDKDTVNGAYYPLRMDYTGNANSAPVLTPSASVQFALDANRTDGVIGYQSGAISKPTKRITGIRTYLGSSLVKEYRLAYAPQSTALDRLRIANITECDSAASCSLPITLTWQTNGPDSFVFGGGITNQYGTAQGWSDSNVYPRTLADVDGDGLPDIVGFGPSGVSVSLNTGGGFFAETVIALPNQFSPAQGWKDDLTFPRILSDVNGDGLPDIVGFGPTGIYVSINSGNGTFASPQPWHANQFSPNQGWANNDEYPRMLADMDGDGRPDVVGFGNVGVYVAVNNGSGFNPPVLPLPGQVIYVVFGTSGFTSGEFGVSLGWASQTANPRYIADINGDGLPDIVGFGAGGVVVGINLTTGSAGMVVQVSGNWAMSDFGVAQGWSNNSVTPRLLADVNGDGLPDIVGFGPNGVVVSLNTGVGFAPAAVWLASQYSPAQGWPDNNVTPRQLADVNGDGLPDIVGFGATGVMVSLNTGSAFTAPTNWLTSFGLSAGGWSDSKTYPRLIVDVNGDGLPDIVGFGSTAVAVATNSRSMSANFVSSISNGSGAVVSPTYASLSMPSSPSTYTKDAGTYAASFPRLDLAAPLYVVRSVARSDGVGGTATTAYSYGGLKAEVGSGRGMLGFRWTKSKELATGIERYTEFQQTWPYVGMASLSETRLAGAGNAGVLKRTVVSAGCQIPKTLAACAIAPSNIYFPYISSSVDYSWDINGAAFPVVTSTLSYGQSPQFGDPTLIVKGTSDGARQATVNSYTPADTANWIAPRISQTVVNSVKP